MIVTLENTSAREVDSRLLSLREEGGVVTLGRVLTLIIITSNDVEPAIAAANDASREHPCRVIVVSPTDTNAPHGQLDAEVRVGADAGASDVVILYPSGPARDDIDTLITPLLLPDTPIVVWWPQTSPERLSEGLLGDLSQRRISDAVASPDPIGQLRLLAKNYTPGDTDLSWARTTLWRGLTAATLDVARSTTTSATVHGNAGHPSVVLYAAWIAHGLGVPVGVEHEDDATAITGLTLEQQDGTVRLHRPEGSRTLTISTPTQSDQTVSLPMRDLSDCLVEDLRRLDPDEVYEKSLQSIFEVTLP